ncbi:MAG: hypothetical protein HY827_03310 [Actinobacteria bacterium]|nr:hypothetical protein [Actinomycetota bacterium]
MRHKTFELRLLLALGLLATAAAALWLARGGGRSEERVSAVPVNPTAQDLRAIGFREEHDGRFSPHGFGLTFSYPDDDYELLASIPEHGEHDVAVDITERRRHFVFAEVATGGNAGTRTLPLMRVARITYSKPFTAERLTDFAARLKHGGTSTGPKQRFKPSKIDGRPALIAALKLANGTGHAIYVASGGRLFQIITYSADGDRTRESRVFRSLISTARFDD